MQEKKQQEERRKYIRLNVANEVNFRVRDKKTPACRQAGTGPLKAKTSGVSKDISMEGICFSTEKQLESGTKLDLEIMLPSGSEPLILKGEVKWSRLLEAEANAKAMFDTGVQLLVIQESDENRYLRYVNQKMMERLSRYLHL